MALWWCVQALCIGVGVRCYGVCGYGAMALGVGAVYGAMALCVRMVSVCVRCVCRSMTW